MKLIKMNFRAYFIILSVLLLASACSSSDSGSSSTEGKTTITGSVYAAPVDSAAVTVKNDIGNVVAGPVTAAADGSYSVDVPTSSLAGNLRFEAVGGDFIDEATGANTSAGRLAAFVEGGSLVAGSAVLLDPSSTVVHDLVTSVSGTTVSIAKSLFGSIFGFAPDTCPAPTNPDSPLTDGSDAPRRFAGMHAAAFSRIAHDLGLTPGQQFELIKAMAKDLSDGIADGLDNGATIEIVPGINLPADWKTQFDSALAAMANIRLTNTYRVTYMPGMGMMAPKTGKSKFKIKLEKRSDNTAAGGLALKLKPMMHMTNGMNHSTPVGIVSESTTTAGIYECTAYYLMASGPTMGFWDLRVEISDGTTTEAAMFFPPVAMTMGADTVRATLKGQDDIISSMTGTERRSYYLFNDGLMTGTTSTLNLFIAAKASTMSYPAISMGTVLSSPTGTWSVDPATTAVQASLDTSFASYVSATDNGDGRWSIPGLALASGTTNTIFVKLNVNGEDKTTNGLTTSGTGTNGYATFLVTLGM